MGLVFRLKPGILDADPHDAEMVEFGDLEANRSLFDAVTKLGNMPTLDESKSLLVHEKGCAAFVTGARGWANIQRMPLRTAQKKKARPFRMISSIQWGLLDEIRTILKFLSLAESESA